jgi:hypothetical protein
MASGLPGADSASPVTSQLGGQGLIDVARNHFGAVPAFWGRYFTSPETKSSVEYHHAVEGAALSASGIRVLPVARQTLRVNGTAEDGAADAAGNAADFLASFGADYLVTQGNTFFVFLDVEGQPSLSADYYTGWAQALAASSSSATGGKVTLRPCIYAEPKDTATWVALKQAMANGADCGGAWVARYLDDGCTRIPDWNDAFVTPAGGAPCPLLIWQYAGNCYGNGGIDCSQTNPALDANDELLRFLVLPPESSGE